MSAEDKAKRAFLRVKLERRVATLSDGIEAERLGLGRVTCRDGIWRWEWADGKGM